MVTTRGKSAAKAQARSSLGLMLRKWCIVSGVMMMFAACIEGFAAGSMANYKLAKGTHHQLTHNSELLIAIAFVFPFCELSPALLKVAFWSLQVGTWGNPLAYLVIALTNCPQPMFAQSGTVAPGDGDDNPYTKLSMGMLMFAVGPSMLVSLVLILVGVMKSSEDVETKKNE